MADTNNDNPFFAVLNRVGDIFFDTVGEVAPVWGRQVLEDQFGDKLRQPTFRGNVPAGEVLTTQSAQNPPQQVAAGFNFTTNQLLLGAGGVLLAFILIQQN